MTTSAILCDVCRINHPNRRVRSQVAPEIQVYYCQECLDNDAEPIGLVNKYLDYNPLWSIPPELLNNLSTYDGTRYISLLEYVETHNGAV